MEKYKPSENSVTLLILINFIPIDIFGSAPLKSEVRHKAYRGKFKKFNLYEEGHSTFLRIVWQNDSETILKYK